MKNYLVITYDEKDNNCDSPNEITKLHYKEPKDVINFIYNLKPKTKYEVYKEIYLEITEEEA